jgi:hypothetical protein
MRDSFWCRITYAIVRAIGGDNCPSNQSVKKSATSNMKKYKNLKSFAHNFVHSFLSFTNFVDNGYVIDDLLEAARKFPVSIAWLPELKVSPSRDLLSDRVHHSIAHFQSWLPQHARNHDVNLENVRELRLEIFKLPSYQLRCDSVIIDDRGKENRQSISF